MGGKNRPPEVVAEIRDDPSVAYMHRHSSERELSAKPITIPSNQMGEYLDFQRKNKGKGKGDKKIKRGGKRRVAAQQEVTFLVCECLRV